jgi:hypothetical protein
MFRSTPPRKKTLSRVGIDHESKKKGWLPKLLPPCTWTLSKLLLFYARARQKIPGAWQTTVRAEPGRTTSSSVQGGAEGGKSNTRGRRQRQGRRCRWEGARQVDRERRERNEKLERETNKRSEKNIGITDIYFLCAMRSYFTKRKR